MTSRTEDELQFALEQMTEERDAALKERDKYHGMLIDYRVSALEKRADKTDETLEVLKTGHIKASVVYTLIFGNGLIGAIALFKLFITP